jgi:Fe-S-cluster containining protein
MDTPTLFERYEQMARKADRAFQKMAGDYGSLIMCRIRCVDCCHAVFGLFLIEAAYLKSRFDGLSEKERRDALLRADKTDKDTEKIGEGCGAVDLSRERARCPLLNEKEACILYPQRPITCRVYGIPTAIHGRGHACGRSGFRKGESYPAFDLDAAYSALYELSKECLVSYGSGDLENAALLVSVSRAIRTPEPEILQGKF